VLVEFAVERLRLGTVLVRVTEHPDRIEPRLGEEPLQLGDVLLGLAGEPDDHVRPYPRVGRVGPDLLDQLEERLGGTEPAHPPQYRRSEERRVGKEWRPR